MTITLWIVGIILGSLLLGWCIWLLATKTGDSGG